MPLACFAPRSKNIRFYTLGQKALLERQRSRNPIVTHPSRPPSYAACKCRTSSGTEGSCCCIPSVGFSFSPPKTGRRIVRRGQVARSLTPIRTPALFGAPADTPACAMGNTLCGAPEAQTDADPPADDVTQAGMGLPAPGGWLWAGLGLVGGYVLHNMLTQKGRK